MNSSSASSTRLLFGLTEESQQVGASQGHPVETEHTQCDTFDSLEAQIPALLLNSATALHPLWEFMPLTVHSAVSRLQEEPA